MNQPQPAPLWNPATRTLQVDIRQAPRLSGCLKLRREVHLYHRPPILAHQMVKNDTPRQYHRIHDLNRTTGSKWHSILRFRSYIADNLVKLARCQSRRRQCAILNPTSGATTDCMNGIGSVGWQPLSHWCSDLSLQKSC
jgi:hypothetical protein